MTDPGKTHYADDDTIKYIATLEAEVAALRERLAGYEDAPVVAWKIVGVCGNPSADRSGFFFNAEKDDRIERWSKLGLTVTSEALIVKPAKEGTKL